MKIGIIGAGFIGRAIARLAVDQGHEVMVSNSRGPHTLTSLVASIGCLTGSAEQAAAFGEVVVVAVPLKNYREIPVAPVAGKVVLDANNYYPERDGHMPELDNHSTTTSELLARHLAGAKIVKAFNSIRVNDLERDGLPAGTPGRRALPISGDDAAAKRTATALIEQFGFDAVDAGPLAEGWRFQRGRPMYCERFDIAGLQKALADNDEEHVI
ncbi:NADPH-dependent F420 reductase [Acerihabitans arboris]|uniref:NADP oxidoreductase n=1 Tax=Acerihabitans arboris TaxID=2691583 RepID=A0A845SIB0_9GAMM|nr:NAD(P)-binding domain-containing protein [Acerihabitans arboris]NDL63669.1 NADP oxidoreductase [Acerihabitans arboris]